MTVQHTEVPQRVRSGPERHSLGGATLERAALTLACLGVWLGPLLNGGTVLWAISALSVLGMLALALTLTLGVLGRLPRPLNPLWMGAGVALLLWMGLSNTWTLYAHEGWRYTALWAGVLGSAWTLHLLATTRRRHAVVLGGILVAGLLSVLYALMQARGLSWMASLTVGNGQNFLTGPFFHPSHFSGYLIALSALTSSLIFFSRPGLHTALLVAFLGLIQYVNLQTDGSSIPGVVLAAGLPLLVWAWRRRPWLGLGLGALGVAGLALVGSLLLTAPGRATFEQYRSTLGFRSSSVESFVDCRRNVFETDLRMWRDQPLRGVGIGQFYWRSSSYRGVAKGRPCEFTNVSLVNYAHNDYLQMAAETGAVGLALWLLLQLSSVLRRPRSVAELAWISVLGAYALVGLYDSHLTYIGGTMMVVYALSALKLPAPRSSPEARSTTLNGVHLATLERDPQVPQIRLERAQGER